jgi:hypothetical protein
MRSCQSSSTKSPSLPVSLASSIDGTHYIIIFDLVTNVNAAELASCVAGRIQASHENDPVLSFAQELYPRHSRAGNRSLLSSALPKEQLAPLHADELYQFQVRTAASAHEPSGSGTRHSSARAAHDGHHARNAWGPRRKLHEATAVGRTTPEPAVATAKAATASHGICRS